MKFAKVYISDLPVVKYLWSALGGTSESESGVRNKTEDPNRPRTRTKSKKKENHEFDVLGESLVKSTASTEEIV